MPHASRPYVKSTVAPKRHETEVPHGTTRGYRTHKCKCPDCSWAQARDQKGRLHAGKPGYVPALGTIRRLLSLGSVGYSHRDIAEAAGITDRTVNRLANGYQDTVSRATAEAVARAFDRLAILTPPVVQPRWRKGYGPAQLQAVIQCARDAGGVPPMAWDDGALDDPEGQPYVGEETTYRQRRIDIKRLLDAIEQGTTDTRMADEFGVTTEALYRALIRKGHEAAYDRLLAWSGREARTHLRTSA